jgi:regulator of protease activity HflC (stomatin/prohibitin superfamily)
MTALSALVILVLIALLLLSASVRLVQQYEMGVVLRFGKLQPHLRTPGLQTIIPFADRLTKVSMQTIVMGIPAQGAITRDNVTLTVDAVVYYRVIDPVKAVINVQNYPMAVSQVAQTSLRSVIGRADLDTLLSDRERINQELKAVIDGPTEEPWGLHIERVEVKDVSLPEGMKRSMSRQAEAERERRARVIAADGEFQASTKLAQAARAMGDTPGALQLRLLQTVVDVAAEKNSTLVMPFPVELLRFFDHAAGTDGGIRTVLDAAGPTPPAATPPAATPPAAMPTVTTPTAATPRGPDATVITPRPNTTPRRSRES